MTNRWMIVLLAACSAPVRKESPPPQQPPGAYVEYEVSGEIPPAPAPAAGAAHPVVRDQPPNIKLKLGHYRNDKLGIGVTVDLTEETESVADIDPAKLRFDGETTVWHLTGRYGSAGTIEYVRDRGGMMLEITRDHHVSVRIPDDETDRWSEAIDVTRDGDADPLCPQPRKPMNTKLVTVCLLLATTTAYADSLEEKKFWKRQRDYIDEKLKVADKACGTKFSFDWDNAPTLRTEVEKTKHTPNGVCGAVIEAVASVCREGPDEKSTVKAKITGFTCGFAKERTLELKGGIVKYSGNNTQSNFDAWAKPWLMKHL